MTRSSASRSSVYIIAFYCVEAVVGELLYYRSVFTDGRRTLVTRVTRVLTGRGRGQIDSKHPFELVSGLSKY